MEWLHQLPNASILNLVSSFLVLVPGVVVLRFCRPKMFADHPYTERVFGFWLVQWFFLIVVWAVYKLVHDRSPVVLACADLYVVSALGLYWACRDADSFRWPQASRNLVGVYACLLLWNLVFAASVSDPTKDVYLAGIPWRRIWIFPSSTMSLIAIGLVAWVFFQRYGFRAIPLSGVTIPVYAFLQRPTYASLFVESIGDDAHWIVALALGKILYGLVFYTLFFSPAETHATVSLPVIRVRGPILVMS